MKIKNVKSGIKLLFRDVYWNIYRKFGSIDIKFSHNKRIIFVCKGNVCRSPFAEYYARKSLKEYASNIEILSAGYSVTEANPTPDEGLQVAKQYGVNLEAHRSRQLTNGMLHESSVVVFEAKHIKAIEQMFPEIKDRIYLLPCLQNNVVNCSSYDLFNISDPYGKNTDAFVDCYKRISWCIDILFTKLN